MKSRVQQLTDELLSLYIKYGRDDFITAVRELRKDNIAETVAAAAEALATVVPIARAKPAAHKYRGQRGSVKQTSQEMLSRYISILEASGDEIKTSVALLLKKILARDVLPSTSSLRGCLENIGIPVGDKLDRHRSAKKIADHLISLPQDEAKTQIRNIEQMKSTQSSLQGWTDIIVKSDQQK
jgi:hypothetical protein